VEQIFSKQNSNIKVYNSQKLLNCYRKVQFDEKVLSTGV